MTRQEFNWEIPIEVGPWESRILVPVADRLLAALCS